MIFDSNVLLDFPSQRFLLDRRTYPTTELIDPALECYQGPALLLYNDSVFKPSDFDSLRSLGKSGKRYEALKTGKFGLGFNSVYNLTDAPMILSGEHLVILEPHEEIKNRDLRGGLQINFINDLVPRNQLKPFEGLLANRFAEQFHGTIIRLPLRTAENAARSEIANDVITTNNILELFDTFKSEALESLLFLKNIEKIEMYELSELPVSATSNDCTPTLLYSLELGEPGNPAQLESLRAERAVLTSALKRCASQHQETQTSCTMTMVISVKSSAQAKVCQYSWLVHHVVGGKAVPDVEEDFLRDEKLLTWIGLATPLDFQQSFSGRLFTFLPLPITTPFPIHVHGIFGLTRDRRNLVIHDPDYAKGSKMDRIATWNQHLFQESIPSAWADFLDKLKEFSRDGLLQYFPPVADDHEAIWKDILPSLLRHVAEKALKVFRKVPLSSSQPFFQWESLNNGFVTNEEEAIVQILADSGMPLIRIPQDIQYILVANSIAFNKITPSAARKYLRSALTNWNEILSAKSKHELLEYLCSDDDFADLAGLRLIPLANGEFTRFISFDNTDFVDHIYVKMTEQELELFGEWSHRLVGFTCLPQLFCDPKKVSDFEQATNLQPWNLESTVSFLEETFFKGLDSSLEEVPDSAIPFERLSELWKWIDEKDDSTGKFDALWLIPTNRGTLRKIRTSHAVILNENSSQEDAQILTQLLQRAGIAFVREGFAVNPSGYLSHSRLIKVISDIDTVMNWLGDVTCPTDLSMEEAVALREYFSKHLRMPNILPQFLESLRALPIYKVLIPSSIVDQKTSIVLRALPANSPSSQLVPIVHQETIPQLDECIFIDVSDSDSNYLVCRILGIGICSFKDFLTSLVLPNLRSQPEHLMDMLIRMVLSNLDKISDDQRKQHLQNLKFVKVCSVDEAAPTCSARRAPSELVDPDIRMLTNLFLPHEAIQPTGIYKERDVIHQLIALGMNTRLTPDLMNDRINCFIDTWAETSEDMKRKIHQNAIKLLAVADNSDNFIYPSAIFQKPWLPAVFHPNERELRLVLASECRDIAYAELASHAIPIVDYEIRNPSLREVLGWDDKLSTAILEAQILGLISAPSIPTISLVVKMTPVLCKLEEIVENPLELVELKTNLCGREWIPVDGRLRATSNVVFNSPISNLHPYASILPSHFVLYAPRFFEFMGVAKTFSNEHLVDILEQIQEASQINENVLDTEQKEMAINIIEYLAQQIEKDDEKAALEGIYDRILIPDATGRLRKISTLTFSNMPRSLNPSQFGPMVGSEISLSVAERLKIPMFSQRILGESMDNKDIFSEYSHKETICTRIRNTLREYSIDSTSNEFVANADDSDSATRVCWVFDRDGQYSTSSLLCPEMAEWQGPAIYCYNDGEFSDEDIEALVRVGSGSKQSNSNKIGKYGLGFMDAYHFTDVPSLVRFPSSYAIKIV